ncbi:hypothetical protein F5X97DRAFT_288344 [Nemania serpens]|nr:hypothetical protein F5X97DRAFT_288344 [Nemania serpens]
MPAANRRTLFLDDELSDGELEFVVRKSPTASRTLKRRRVIGLAAPGDAGSTEVDAKPVSNSGRFPVIPTKPSQAHELSLVPVLTGSPWSHYERRYRVRYGFSFGIITSRNASCQTFMIRTVTGRDTEDRIQNIRQLCHPNLAKNLEIYACSDSSYFLVSEFMPTSLLHLCRSPIYPTEPQLGSLLHQVLIGLEFLLDCGLVHETLSCGNLLVNFAGEVKICDIENCQRSGNMTALSTSLSRVMMRLMDKERTETMAVGLTHPDKWSHDAIDLFTAITATADIQKLLAHNFLLKKN